MPTAESKPTSTAKCGRPPNSAYLELMKENEDWRQLENAAERRKIQNRLAQRAYRRNLRNRNKEIETLREQLNRFQEVDGKVTGIIQSSSSSDEGNSKGSSRSSPKACFARPGSAPNKLQAAVPNKWMASNYEMGISTSTPGASSSGDPQFFDTYPDLDSDDSMSLASGSTPGDHHSVQFAPTDFGVQIMYDDHAKLSPLSPAFNTMHPYETGCIGSGEDPGFPADSFRPGIDYESSALNQHYLAPLPQKPSPRYAAPIEFSRPVALASDEEENSFCFGYNTTSTAEPGVPLTTIPPSITDIPAAAPGTHAHDSEGRRSYTMNSPDVLKIHPTLLCSSSPSPPKTTPVLQQPAWPHVKDCAISSLLHIAVAGGYRETVWLILDHWPELAHAVDSEGYTAAQRAIMTGRDDVISMFIH
ncbi:hypothetical protein PG993_013053 [Apiospora rasikravindrae]|uniref:BZIP domain-containing protein n=1 Tax=Apiospora rasikravindrae TaxID=990691 RepID=A0ABR1RWJ2_9PEZI